MAVQRAPVTAYVSLGANLGDAVRAVRQALQDLARLPHTRLIARSSLWRSAPVDAEGPPFINAVAELHTRLSAHDLLRALQALEQAAGRQRPSRHAPRTLDLDLLCHGEACIDTPELQLPHPRMTQRAFVLRPLAEIAPQRVPAVALAAVAGQKIERCAEE
jgi:2-amino-4-hydroxy-6-hydroxymethyldihydropteridine diphosphokinase